MAEGIVNHELGDKITAYSAGTTPTVVNPRAIESMAEIGIDIAGQRSKAMDEFAGQHFAYVITLCDSAKEQCPLFSGGVKKLHLGFADPAAAVGSKAETAAAFRMVRDEIKDKLLEFFQMNLGGADVNGN